MFKCKQLLRRICVVSYVFLLCGGLVNFTKQLGFVINQLSGAGCDHMGNFPTLPIAGALRVSPDSILNMQTPVG